MLVINGEFDKPNAKSARIAREVKNAKIVVLPGKSHLTAIAAGYIPREYIDSTVEFINANDPK
jgi:ribose 5-phosphate isomerase RpiB